MPREAAVDPLWDVSSSDTSAVGHLMRMYRDSGYPEQACAFAERMKRLVPQDGESAALLRDCERLRFESK